MVKFSVITMSLICLNNQKLYVTSREHIFVLDMELETDDHFLVPDLKITDNKTTKACVQNSETKNVTSLEFSKCGQYIVIATENKWVVVYNKCFQILRSFMITRTASKVCFTPNNDVLVADKSGDVYLYQVNSENKGTLLLGHRSVILDLLLSNCGKYLITCDRDEKIRVSCYPNCYNIVSYCLGHSEFVTKIKFLTDKILVSASGDGTVRLWNFMEGEEVNLIDTNKYVEDRNLLQKFASRFEKTEICALPVSDMNIHFSSEYYLAVSICGCDLIQLYKLDSQNLTYTYLTKFVIKEPFQFHLDSDLYILSKKIAVFSYLHGNYVTANLKVLEEFSEKYKDIMVPPGDNSITLLYKRKFDNVQEYLERKKQRTEIK